MDVLGLIWIPDFVLWILLFLVVLYVYGTWPYQTLSAHGYKGPKPKPFIGNVDLIYQTGHYGSWDLTGKKLFGNVFAMYEGRLPTLVVFDPDVLQHVLVKEFSNFTDRRDMVHRGDVMKHSLLDLAGAEWKRVRGLTSPFFTTGKLKRNIEHLDECTKQLLTRCESFVDKGEEIDAKEVIGAFTMETICLTGFGLKIDSQNDPDHSLLQTCKKFQNLNLNQFGIMLGFFFPFLVPFLDRLGTEIWPKGAVSALCQFTDLAIEERRKSEMERSDFIQAMIKAHEVENERDSEGDSQTSHRGKGLTEKEIAAQVALFILAGYDTVSTTLSFLLFNLANNQDHQERVAREIKDVIGDAEMTYDNLKGTTYLDMCLSESLRLHPAGFRNERKCLRDTTINGYFIPKDTVISIPIYGIHHDPDLWTDPETFDPERFSEENRQSMNPYAYLAFGQGPRNCVGMRLAQIEVKMAAIQILRKFKITLGKKMQMPLQFEDSLFPKAKGGIWLHLEKRYSQ